MFITSFVKISLCVRTLLRWTDTRAWWFHRPVLPFKTNSRSSKRPLHIGLLSWRFRRKNRVPSARKISARMCEKLFKHMRIYIQTIIKVSTSMSASAYKDTELSKVNMWLHFVENHRSPPNMYNSVKQWIAIVSTTLTGSE